MSAAWRNLLGKNVHELRLVFDQASPASAGLRGFIKTNFVQLKAQHPNLPILVREGTKVPSSVYARFDFGREDHVDVSNMTEAQVTSAVEKLVTAKSS